MNDMKQIWDIPPGKRIAVDPEDAWELFRNRVLEKPKRSHINTGRSTGRRDVHRTYQNKDRQQDNSVRLMAYFAATAAVILVAFLFTYDSAHDAVVREVELSMQEKTTEEGQRTTVRPAEGNRVERHGAR